MGPMSVNESLLQKRRGNDPQVFAMTLNLHENQEPSAARSTEVPAGKTSVGEATELSVLSSGAPSLGAGVETGSTGASILSASTGVSIPTGSTAQGGNVHEQGVEQPASAISQPIPPPQKLTDEMEPPPTPKRKVSFAPDLLPPEETLTAKGHQNVSADGTTPPQTPLAQRTQLNGSLTPTVEEVDRILQARIRGPLVVMVTLLILVVLLLVAISGTMAYFLLTLQDELMHRTNSTLPAPA